MKLVVHQINVKMGKRKASPKKCVDNYNHERDWIHVKFQARFLGLSLVRFKNWTLNFV